jgi:Cache 3/Cache 2 fusion domain
MPPSGKAFSQGGILMNFKPIGFLKVACLIGAAAFFPSLVQAQDAKVKPAMWLLESEANKLGSPKINGTDTVAGKQVPAIYFGSTKMNNNFDLVDQVVKEAQGTATIFVKNGEEYVRVATNVKKDDGSRAVGTILDPKGISNPSRRMNHSTERWTFSVSPTSQVTSRSGTHRRM